MELYLFFEFSLQNAGNRWVKAEGEEIWKVEGHLLNRRALGG